MIKPSFADLMHFVDLTCLQEEVSAADLAALAQTATDFRTAAVCVWPKDLARLPANLSIQKATVVNFPHGNEKISAIQQQIDTILHAFPQTEIDYVFPYLQYWAGETTLACKHCQLISEHCHAHGVKIKVILETGYQLDPQQIYKLALDILDCQVDILKTSTGKIANNASLEAVDAICQALISTGHTTGIKVSGGIRHYNQALSYYDLISHRLARIPSPDWLRFGTSQLNHD